MILHSDVIRTFYNFGSLALFPCKEILINVPFEQQDCTSGVAKPGPTRALARAMLGRARANIFIILKI